MDNIILGLLLLSSRTIYQLRERIDKGLSLMYSASMGSIQAAVKKLLAGGYITFSETVESGKYKKVYSITDSGRQRFFDWVNSPIESADFKNPNLVKIYFMGFAEKNRRAEIVGQHLAELREKLGVLTAICEEGERAEVPEQGRDIFYYQLLTARYGADFLRFNIDWYENLLAEISGGKI